MEQTYLIKINGPTMLDENVLQEVIKDGLRNTFKKYSVTEVIIEPKKKTK